MQLQYVGFEQVKNVREYIFHGVVYGEETKVFVVSTDMALFLRHHVHMQDGPVLCLRALRAELETLDPATQPASRREITDQHMLTYMASPGFDSSKKSGHNKRPRVAAMASVLP